MPRVHHGGHEAAAAAAVVRYGAPRPPPGVLCKSYRCHSMACLDRPGLELGDKIIMPQSAFKEAHQLRLRLPLLFKVVGKRRKGIVGPPPCQFCGVLEFSARQGQVFLPYWMMQNLLLSEGEQVELRSILHPPAGSFVRFRPHNDTFLNVAAQQGPKALMECALRRYSVLSEGVTILVQHENENFYLDVVELRTSASPLPDVGAEDDNDEDEGYSSEWCDDQGREGRQGDAGSRDDNHRDLAGGKRVRLVSLLGDLDLEVEFSPPHPSPPVLQKAGEHLAELLDAEEGEEEEKHSTKNALAAVAIAAAPAPAAAASGRHPASSSDIPAMPSTQDRVTGVVEGSRQTESAAYLPAPAKAKSCDSVVAVAAEPSRKAGWLNMPSRDVFARLTKCRAFSGFGVALGGARSGDKNQPNPPDDDYHRRHISRGGLSGVVGHRTEETQQQGGATADAETSTRLADVSGDETRGAVKPTAYGELPGGIGAGGGASLNGPGTAERENGNVGGRKLGEGLLEGMPAIAMESSPVVGAEAGGKKGPGAGGDGEMVPCAFCGKSVPVANRCVHELRCSSAVRRAGIEGGPQQRSAVDVQRVPSAELYGALERRQDPVGNIDQPLSSLGKPNTTVKGTGSSPPRQGEASKRSGRSQTRSFENRSSDGDVSGRPLFGRTGTDQHDGMASSDDHPGLLPSGGGDGGVGVIAGTRALTARKAFDYDAEAGKSEGSCTSSTLPRRDDVQAPPQLSPPPPLPCGFCGLSFRTADAMNAHETLCGTRTERCERCCGHVSRRDSESHGKPGGACDSAIAAAVAHEEHAKAVAISAAADAAAADASGMEASDGGGGVPGGRGLNGGIRSSVGKFDSLLAEAIRSSKAASATLEAARVRNDGLEMSLSGRSLKQPRGGNDNGTKKSAITDAPSAGHRVFRNKGGDAIGTGTDGRQVTVSIGAGSISKSEDRQGGDARAAGLMRQDSTGATSTLSSLSCLGETSRAGCKQSDDIESTNAAAAAAAAGDSIAPSAQRTTSTFATERQRGLSDFGGIHSLTNHGLNDPSQQEDSPVVNRDGTSAVPPPGEDACAIREGLAIENANQLNCLDGENAGGAVRPGNVMALDETHESRVAGGDDAGSDQSNIAESTSGAGRRQWTCARCTLENSSRVAACEACGSARVENGVDGHRTRLATDYCAPELSVETAPAVTAAATISTENIVGVRRPSGGGCADAREVKSGMAASPLALATGSSGRSHALLEGRARGRHVSLRGIAAFPPEPTPAGSIHSLMEGRNSSLPSDPVVVPSTASLTTPLHSSSGAQPRCINSNSSSDDAKGHGGRGGLCGANARLEPPSAVAGSMTGLARGHAPPWSPAVRTPVLRPIPANTAAGGVLRGNAAVGSDLAGATPPTVITGDLGVHPIPMNNDGSTPSPHTTRFKHPRQPQARKSRVEVSRLPPRDISASQQQANKAKQGRGGSTMIRMRPRRLGGVERPPRSRYPQLSPPSDDQSAAPEQLELAAHFVSVACPRTVPELAATTDLFSRPLTLRSSSTGLAASRHERRAQCKPWQQQQQGPVDVSAPRPRVRREHGSSGNGSGSGSSSGSINGSGGGGPVVLDAGSPAGAPACDLSLLILGRSQGAPGHGLDPVSGARASVGVGQVPPVEGVMRRVPHEPARGVIGGSRVRYDRGERGRRIGVAPSKLRRRVSDTRVLEPLHPN